MDFMKEVKALQNSTYYLIKRSQNEEGVTPRFITFYRQRVLKILGKKAFKFLDKHLDARDYYWRVSSKFSWKALRYTTQN